MKFSFERNYPAILFTLLLLFFGVTSLLSEGYYGGADNISHYFISHFAFHYPHLFMSPWGRPLYTILSSPFALFGLAGLKIFNVLLGMATAWTCYGIAKKLEIKPAWMVLLLVCFTPLYYVMMPTALTEILFSFVLALAVLLFLRGSYIASAVVISLIPFARSEGFILFPLFFLAFLWHRQYRAIPFLAAGVIFFNLAGWAFTGDLLWVLTQFPYPVTYRHPVYNTGGSLWHFLEIRDYILGLPLEILFLAGVIVMLKMLFSRQPRQRTRAWLMLLLVLGPFAVYTKLHAILYWLALGGSMGLERVLAAVLPMAAIVALKGYNELEEILGKNSYLQYALRGIVIGAVVVTPFRIYPLVFPLSPEEQTVKEATAWFKASPLAGKLVYYTDNNVPYYLGLDPYEEEPPQCQPIETCKALDTLPTGVVLFWDAHFGANESKIARDSLLDHPKLRLVNIFRPAEPWITFGGYPYECLLLRTLEYGQKADNYAILDSLHEAADNQSSYRKLLQNGFENPGDAWDASYLSDGAAHWGSHSFIMDERTEFSPGLTITVKELDIRQPKPSLRAGVYVLLPEKVTGIQTRLIISFENGGQSYGYHELDINQLNLRLGRWNRVSLTAPLPAFKTPDDLVKVYLWNPGKQQFLIDDLRVDLVTGQ